MRKIAKVAGQAAATAALHLAPPVGATAHSSNNSGMRVSKNGAAARQQHLHASSVLDESILPRPAARLVLVVGPGRHSLLCSDQPPPVAVAPALR